MRRLLIAFNLFAVILIAPSLINCRRYGMPPNRNWIKSGLRDRHTGLII